MVLAVDKASGALVRGPEVFGRGVAGIEGAEGDISREAAAALEELSPQARGDRAEVQEALRGAVRRCFRGTRKRARPCGG